MQNEDIVIRQADKGGAVVVQNKTAYIREIERQVADEDVYIPLQSDPTFKYSSEIKAALKQALREQQISDMEFKFLFQMNPIRPVLYTLPKIHKNLLNPPGRPIVSGIGSLTEPLSQFVDAHIKDLVYTLPSYLRDTMDFLKKLSDCHVDSDDLLCTMDVSSLYPSIPHKDGLDAMEHYLKQRRVQDPSTEFLLTLSREILTKNYFKFQDRYYLQHRGSAMGSPMAPNYANLFMGKFELDFVYNNNPYSKFLKRFWRYIDDLYFIWSGSTDDLKNFHAYMKSKMPSIKFTLEFSLEQISFLDVLIKKDGTTLHTELYKKDTDRNTLLHFSSYHSPALKRSLPFSQLTRVRRICDSNSTFESHAKDLCEGFKERGYGEKLLNAHLNKVRQINRSDLLTPKPNKDQVRLAMVSTYSPISTSVKRIVNKHWHILKTDPHIANVFTHSPRHFYKRTSNLRDLLVKSDISGSRPTHFLSRPPSGNFPCHNCVHCYAMVKGNMFTHPNTGREYAVKGRITCNTTHVIYILKCPCNLYYVGKTKRFLKTRICEHKSSTRNHDEKSSVARHFNRQNHSTKDLKYMGIEAVQAPRRGGDRDNLLLKREAFWIYTLDTLIPKGMNEEIVLSCFL
ncbi:hypothetical protein ACEWY4_018382 [Coilia grayii]|uniref:Reverse transcriptase domain-containing protein n=1 Tax=Coilia grayii TaxID=363190 RepID=A0ABD1JJH6_9TELE